MVFAESLHRGVDRSGCTHGNRPGKRLAGLFVLLVAGALAVLGGCGKQDAGAAAQLNADWPVYGGAADQQHYSPLSQVNAGNVQQLGLVWFYDLPPVFSASQPIAVGGKLFVVNGHGDVRAFAGASGQLLWEWESRATERSGAKLRQGYGVRGLAYEDGRVFVGTHDGRLVALEAATGKPAWSVQTVAVEGNAFISGAPRAFDGRVIIGFGGADGGGERGYVSCYDTKTGKLLWRFFTVPGNPAVDTDETTRIAAASWNGEWWKKGGGGTAWNSFAYDPELKLFYIGTGNGYPYNQAMRSPGGGDNLFLASIVAVNAETGKYVWHYQVNPGEQWDYKATMDITLATVQIGGQDRKVLMQAPTNGFFYVIDRETGELLSAEPFTKVTWAERIDLKTGRPIENPGARYHGRGIFEMWPSIIGGHSWPPQSFSPKTGLVYLPTIRQGMLIGDEGLDLTKEVLPTRPANINQGMGVTGDFAKQFGGESSSLQAWDPVAQKARWSVDLPGRWPGGAMASGGNLVFQGRMDNRFDAYDALSGRRLWHYDVGAPIVAAPISYAIAGRQYVTVITGNSGSGGGYHSSGQKQFAIDYRVQPRRVLTFALGGAERLPPAPKSLDRVRPDDPDYRPDKEQEFMGMIGYAMACGTCHGANVVAAGTAPDLRLSGMSVDNDLFLSVVRDGALKMNGMPDFHDMPPAQMAAIRQYIRAEAHKLPAPSIP
jgi:quinohemoprotein ethanol dehydrogenase